MQSWIAPILAHERGSLPGLVGLPEYQSSPSSSSGLKPLFGVSALVPIEDILCLLLRVDITVEVSEDHRSSVQDL